MVVIDMITTFFGAALTYDDVELDDSQLIVELRKKQDHMLGF